MKETINKTLGISYRIISIIEEASMGLVLGISLIYTIITGIKEYIPEISIIGYINMFIKQNDVVKTILLYGVLTWILFVMAKLFIINIHSSAVSKIKILIPSVIICVLFFSKNYAIDLFINKFNINSETSKMIIYYMIVFWIMLIGSLIKKICGGNGSIREVTEFTESYEVAVKYYDGSTSNADLEACDNIANKYTMGD